MVLFPSPFGATAMLTPPFAVGFLGAGQMATALAKGWLAAGLLDKTRSMASDPYPHARVKFAETTGVRTLPETTDALATADVLVLAVNPQVMALTLEQLLPLLRPAQLVISIAAGVTLETLSTALGGHPRLVRVMPNTPCLVGASASGVAAKNPDDAALAMTLMGAVGVAVSVPESQLDAVTGLSGSGPAYVYVIIEALADGGVRMGLPRDVALKLAAQTVFGAAKMVLDTGTHPAALKDAVASPGGTTIAGLHELERGGLRGVLMDAVQAATERAKELGGG